MEIHGADIYTASEISGYNEDDIMDFSSNINPLGIPETVISAAVNSIKYTDRYPDINSRKLIDAISEFEETPKEFIFVSNGAGEAIFRIAACLRPQIGLITAPSFSEYEKSMKLFGADINYYPLQEKNSFKIKEDILNYINEKTKNRFYMQSKQSDRSANGQNIWKKLF